jgi:hypothetical protein
MESISVRIESRKYIQAMLTFVCATEEGSFLLETEMRVGRTIIPEVTIDVIPRSMSDDAQPVDPIQRNLGAHQKKCNGQRDGGLFTA